MTKKISRRREWEGGNHNYGHLESNRSQNFGRRRPAEESGRCLVMTYGEDGAKICYGKRADVSGLCMLDQIRESTVVVRNGLPQEAVVDGRLVRESSMVTCLAVRARLTTEAKAKVAREEVERSRRLAEIKALAEANRQRRLKEDSGDYSSGWWKW